MSAVLDFRPRAEVDEEVRTYGRRFFVVRPERGRRPTPTEPQRTPTVGATLPPIPSTYADALMPSWLLEEEAALGGRTTADEPVPL